MVRWLNFTDLHSIKNGAQLQDITWFIGHLKVVQDIQDITRVPSEIVHLTKKRNSYS